jgi:hypothetical protein
VSAMMIDTSSNLLLYHENNTQWVPASKSPVMFVCLFVCLFVCIAAKPQPDRKNGINLIPSRYHWDQLDAKLIVLDINGQEVLGPGLANERTLSAVPSRIFINSSRCDTTPRAPVANSYNHHFSLEGDITLGGHPSKY